MNLIEHFKYETLIKIRQIEYWKYKYMGDTVSYSNTDTDMEKMHSGWS